jgi:hypothetical protein
MQPPASAEQVNSEDMEAFLVQELNAMSLQERESVYEEIHGVIEVPDETPEFVAECLQAFDEELRNIQHKPAYDLAERMNAAYVSDCTLRLSFLRADYFNAQKAAHRFVRFMDGKLEFFGPGVLARPIFVSDLDDDDMVCLKAGMFQLLPVRDRKGRAIVMHFKGPHRNWKRPENMVRLCLTQQEPKSPNSLD